MTLSTSILLGALSAELLGPDGAAAPAGAAPDASGTQAAPGGAPAGEPTGGAPGKQQDPLSLQLPGELPPAQDAQPVQYAATGDVGLDVALDFIGSLGFGPEHAAVAAAQRGDFSLLETALKALGPKAAGYERILKLGKASWESRGKAQAEQATKDREQILGLVGGDKAWTDIQTWARSQSTPSEAAEINKALKAGGFVAKAVATTLAQKYEQSKAGTIDKGSPVAPGAGRVPDAGGALSPADYSKAISALTVKIGAHRVAASPEYQALRARRAAFRG